MSIELVAKAKKTRLHGDSTAKLLLIVLADYANDEGMAWPSVKTMAEETEKKGTVKVWFPNTVGVPDEFSQVESIILDIIPCHLLVEFYFRYLTWLECEAQKFTWQSVEDAHHTWESFEKAVPKEE